MTEREQTGGKDASANSVVDILTQRLIRLNDERWVGDGRALGFDMVDENRDASISSICKMDPPIRPRTTMRVFMFVVLVGCAPALVRAQAGVPQLTELTTNLASAPGGKNPGAHVNVSGPAPAGGIVVQLSSNAPGAAAVPASVTIAEGKTTADFLITTKPVAQTIAVTISAASGGVTKTLILNVLAPEPSVITLPVHDGSVSVTGRVALIGPAPPSGVVVFLTSTDPVRVPGSVTVPGGASVAEFDFTTLFVTQPTAVPIQATAAGATKSATFTVVPPAPVRLTIATPKPGGIPMNAIITLTRRAPPSGVTIQLASSNGAVAAVPPSITVRGDSIAEFAVITLPVAQSAAVTITATSNVLSKSAAITVLPPSPTRLGMVPSTVVGGQRANGEVLLDGPAPLSGYTIRLTSSNPAIASPPESITIPGGGDRFSFGVPTTPVTQSASATITFALPTGNSLTSTLAVERVGVGAVVISPASVAGGLSSTGQVHMTGVAPADGFVVQLQSSDPAAASVPPSVTVPFGEAARAFAISAKPVDQSRSVTITASASGISKSASFTVAAPTLDRIIVPQTVIGGGHPSASVSLASPAGPSGVVVELTSSDTSKVNVPSTAFVSAGSTSGTFLIHTRNVAVMSTVTVSAAFGGVRRSATIQILP